MKPYLCMKTGGWEVWFLGGGRVWVGPYERLEREAQLLEADGAQVRMGRSLAVEIDFLSKTWNKQKQEWCS